MHLRLYLTNEAMQIIGENMRCGQAFKKILTLWILYELDNMYSVNEESTPFYRQSFHVFLVSKPWYVY